MFGWKHFQWQQDKTLFDDISMMDHLSDSADELLHLTLITVCFLALCNATRDNYASCLIGDVRRGVRKAPWVQLSAIGQCVQLNKVFLWKLIFV